ncbi:flagellar assembly peptidoglycan hydrolase FlgJ [Litorilituus sediminis]|uniref:Peptidoglycan hydrolase FlgJ n=1 Tax=Litorilituus sediminis TaxID=718192 RepID=A0A4P6P739_9GAMM|nr:flagellar assembly peptidoglycan hydrolase FlgJ [Litorilituus sediminis]QBG35235.1 flagellar assembly peptidoglycan hydrolase FlgJ [Litorilituus sediminis]
MDNSINKAHAFDQARNSLELNGLNDIRKQSRAEDGEAKKAALKEAAQQFEAIFMKMLLASMRKAQDVLESDSPFNSQSTKFYRDMHDQQMAVELSSNGTLGLTDLIVRQLGGDDEGYKPSSVLRNDGNLAEQSSDESSLRDKSMKNSLLNQFQHQQQSAGYDKDEGITVFNNPSILGSQAANQGLNIPFALSSRQVKANEANENVKMSSPSFDKPEDFVTALTKPAQMVQEKLGVPFEVVIAQAALETGWGQKIIKAQDGTSSNNLFNIKADSRWSGDKVSKETLEFEQGTMVKKKEPFRTYQSLTESVKDYIDFLSNSDRYQDALQKSNNVEHFLQGLQKAGYATDPQYANKIMGTLKKVTNLLAN